MTNSSAAVGCTPIVASKSALVAPSRNASAKPWITSGASCADHVAAEHALAHAIDDQLDQPLLVAAAERVLERREPRAIDVELADGARARSCSRQADARDRRLTRTPPSARARSRCTRRSPPNIVCATAWPSAIATGVSAMRPVQSPTANMCSSERAAVRHRPAPRRRASSRTPISARPEPAVRGARPIAHSTRSDAELHAVAQRQRKPVCARARSRAHFDAAAQVDALLAQHARHVIAHVPIEARQDLLAAVHELHARAERVKDARELEPDVAAADQRHALGQRARDETPRRR